MGENTVMGCAASGVNQIHVIKDAHRGVSKIGVHKTDSCVNGRPGSQGETILKTYRVLEDQATVTNSFGLPLGHGKITHHRSPPCFRGLACNKGSIPNEKASGASPHSPELSPGESSRGCFVRNYHYMLLGCCFFLIVSFWPKNGTAAPIVDCSHCKLYVELALKYASTYGCEEASTLNQEGKVREAFIQFCPEFLSGKRTIDACALMTCQEGNICPK